MSDCVVFCAGEVPGPLVESAWWPISRRHLPCRIEAAAKSDRLALQLDLATSNQNSSVEIAQDASTSSYEG
jgi:hypothetical protein